MKSFEALDAKGKTVLLRVDLNTSLVNGEPQDSPRFAQAGETVRLLARRGAKVAVIAHQGRPGGDDFSSLEKHAVLLSRRAKKKVKFVPDLFGSATLEKIRSLGEGKILLLENSRFYSEESAEGIDYSKTLLVKSLSSVADCFVNDAFSASHRSQATVTGFPQLLPSYAGPHLAEEAELLSRLRDSAEKPVVYCLGGAKVEECFNVAEYAFANGKAQSLLASGVFGDLLFLASGKDLGLKREWLEKKGFLKHSERARRLWEGHKDDIALPIDFAFADDEGFRVETRDASTAPKSVFDVGGETLNLFKRYLKDAKTVFVKGPAGRYEEPPFELGTKTLFKLVSSSKAFTVVGGGDSGAALEKLGFKEKDFGHVCTAGGAMLDFLTGKELPGLVALENNAIEPKQKPDSEVAGAEAAGSAVAGVEASGAETV